MGPGQGAERLLESCPVFPSPMSSGLSSMVRGERGLCGPSWLMGRLSPVTELSTHCHCLLFTCDLSHLAARSIPVYHLPCFPPLMHYSLVPSTSRVHNTQALKEEASRNSEESISDSLSVQRVALRALGLPWAFVDRS